MQEICLNHAILRCYSLSLVALSNLNLLHARYHPCRYLMIFLKFVSAVIPTIEYDYTREITM